MSPVYYFSSSANTIIELASQKVPFKSFQYLKSKSRNSQSSSNLYSFFDEMRKILFVAKITAFSISNPSSTVPFVVSTDSDPFSNYFSIKSSIKSFKNSPNFFRYYNMQMKDINYYYSDDDDENSIKKAKEIQNKIDDKNKEDLQNDEYENDKVQQICKVEESFFSFDPLTPLFTPSNNNISHHEQIHIQNKTDQKSTTHTKKKNYFLYINFLFYSNIRSNFDIKRSNPSDVDFEILIIFTFLIYIGFRIGLLIHNRKKFNEAQKEWKSLILLPNASTIDLIRCQYTCIICRNKMTTKTAKRLRCHHCIHLTCLIKWTKLRNKCPLCQDEIIMKQDGNGHYSYFYNYNRNIFSHTINKNRHNRNNINYFSDFFSFLTNKNNAQKINNNYNVDGVGKNSDEDEQNVSPYLLFYVCSLRKFRFLRRHLLIINKKCSSNLSDFIEKKKNKLNQNENNNMDNFIIFNSNFNNEQINEFILNENPGLWYFLNDFYYDNDVNRINNDANQNDNNVNENNVNDTHQNNNNNNGVIVENTVNNNHNNSINFQKKNFIMNFNNENENGEEQAARRLVSQYKTRFEFDHSLINVVIQEMHNNFPFLLKEENFLNNQQKELRNIRDVSQEEIEENIQLALKISLMIKKYRAAFKEIEDEESWTRFCNPLDEI